MHMKTALKNFVTDNPNLKDFNCICINRKPNDPNSITGGDVRGLYWTYPNETKKEEKRLGKVMKPLIMKFVRNLNLLI